MTDAILNRAHAALAAVSAVLLVASAAATGIAGIIMAFGGHVSAINVTAWTAAGSAAALFASKAIDSAHNAWVTGKVAGVAQVVSSTGSVDAAAIIQALGEALSKYGKTASAPPIA